MGTEQLLRSAGLTLGLLLVLTAAKAHARPHPPPDYPVVAPERIIILDLRTEPGLDPGQRVALYRSFAERMAGTGAVQVVGQDSPDSDPARLLAGEPLQHEAAARSAAAAALGSAASARDQGDCQAASQQAHAALTALSALQAGGADVTDGLQSAYVHLLLCAHQRGDTGTALLTVRRLSQLGVSEAPQGVSSLIWNLYPVVDATTNVQIVELAIITEPAGAAVWLDHQKVGDGPVTVFVPEGEHLVAVASAATGMSMSQTVIVSGKAQSVNLSLPRNPSPWQSWAIEMAAWKRDRSGPDEHDMAALMKELSVRIALILRDKDRVEIWALGPGETAAKHLGESSVNEPGLIVALVQERVRAWDQTGPDPNVALLHEPLQVERRTGKGKSTGRQKWWVYATVIGTVALATGVILGTDLGDDRQRIELRWP